MIMLNIDIPRSIQRVYTTANSVHFLRSLARMILKSGENTSRLT